MNRRQLLRSVSVLGGALVPARISALAAPKSRAQRLHVGAQTNIWGVPIPSYDALLKILDALARLEYAGFETNFKSLQPQFGQAAQCRQDFGARHVQLVALHAGAKLWPQDEVSAEIETLREIAASSAELGAKYFIVSGGRLPIANGQVDVEAVHVWTDSLNRLGKAVQATGVQLCYHNHQNEFAGEPNLMSFLLTKTDAKLVRLNFDIGHAIGWIDPAAFSREHFQRIAIYHIKDEKVDSDKKRTYTPLGEGQANLPGVFAPLLDS
jgi:sugar phosphate isomerase/epimerase